VQADELAELGKPDALAVARDFLKDRKCAPERLNARSSASSSMVGSFDRTSRATAVLRGGAGLSLVFGLVRDFTDGSPGAGRTLSGCPLR
jgi:hypothetical protein